MDTAYFSLQLNASNWLIAEVRNFRYRTKIQISCNHHNWPAAYAQWELSTMDRLYSACVHLQGILERPAKFSHWSDSVKEEGWYKIAIQGCPGLTVYQSLNQPGFNSSNMSNEARLGGVTAEWISNDKFSSPRHQQVIGHAGVDGGKAKSKRCIFRCFWKVGFEGTKQTDTGRLFHGEGLVPALVLMLGTDRAIPLYDLSERDGSDVTNIVCG